MQKYHSLRARSRLGALGFQQAGLGRAPIGFKSFKTADNARPMVNKPLTGEPGTATPGPATAIVAKARPGSFASLGLGACGEKGNAQPPGLPIER